MNQFIDNHPSIAVLILLMLFSLIGGAIDGYFRGKRKNPPKEKESGE